MNRLTVLAAGGLALLLAMPLAAAPSDYARVVADGHRAPDNRKLDIAPPALAALIREAYE